MVVDYELASGNNIKHPKHGTTTSWGVKAEMIKKMMRYIIKMYPQFDYPVFKKVKTLNSFSACYHTNHQGYPGLATRHKLMMNEAAETAIIGNLAAFYTCGPLGQAVPTNRAGAGRINHELVYKRTGSHPVIVSEDSKKYRQILRDYKMYPKKRLWGKQKFPP